MVRLWPILILRGHFIELWDHNDVLDLFKLVEDAARDWDGSDPVRGQFR